MNFGQERFDHLSEKQVEEYFRKKAYPLLKRNEVYRFVCGLKGQKTPNIKNLLLKGSDWR